MNSIQSQIKKSSYVKYYNILHTYILPEFDNVPLSELTSSRIQKFCDDLLTHGSSSGEGLSPKTVLDILSLVRSLLRYAQIQGYQPPSTGKEIIIRQTAPDTVVIPRSSQDILCRYLYANMSERNLGILLCLFTGMRVGEICALKWEDFDFSTAQLHVRRTINRLAKYEAHDGENKTEIVFGTPKTKNSCRIIPLTRTMIDELTRWKNLQAQDKQRAGDKYLDNGFVVTNEFGHYFEQKTFKDYYNRLLKDADIGHFTFHALRHTFATRALERGMDYKTLSAILGHYSVAFTMDTYVHSMDEHKRNEMNKMDDMFGAQYSISVDNQPYPVLCTITADGCIAHAPDFPKIEIQAPTLDTALLEVKQQIQKGLHQYKYPPIPTRQEQIVVPDNSVLVLVKAG